MGVYLGIDVGTSSVKVGLMTENGGWTARSAAVAGASQGLLDGEMDPEVWWVATRAIQLS